MTSEFSSALLRLVAFRHTSPGRDPLSGSGAQQFGGRWNRAGGSAAVYLADSLQTCVAEFRRMAAGQGRGIASFLPRDLHHVALTGVRVVDLTAAGALNTASLSLSDITASDWTKCQQVGEAAALAGFAGLRVPSATGDGHVIVLFEAHVPKNRIHIVRTEQLVMHL